METRQVVIVAFEGAQSLDVTGPLEVFAGAARLTAPTDDRRRPYAVSLLAPGGSEIECSSGLWLGCDGDLDGFGRSIDTLIIAGGEGALAASEDAGLVGLVREAAMRSRRVTSVCTGAFVLAQTGLLDGRSATTHWSACAELAARHPAVRVEPDPIYTRDGRFYTSAGVTAGMDLALALVEEDLGRAAALTIARWLVLFLRRPGNQSQFSAQLSVQLAQHESIRELQQWIVEHPGACLAIDALAERVAMSPRNFARRFAAEVGVTPGRYVELVRVEAARRQLEDTRSPIARVAAQCGFGTPETMRRSFVRALGVSAAEYRRRFVTAA